MTKKEQKYIIAIDGGVATGKSTIAKAVAKELNFVYINFSFIKSGQVSKK